MDDRKMLAQSHTRPTSDKQPVAVCIIPTFLNDFTFDCNNIREGRTLNSIQDSKQRYVLATGVYPTKKDIRGREPQQKQSQEKHVYLKNEERSFACEMRGVITSPEQIAETSISEHAEEKQCNICGKHFSRKDHLKRHHKMHERMQHVSYTKERPYRCEICNRHLTRREHLIRHQKTHTHYEYTHRQKPDQKTCEENMDRQLSGEDSMGLCLPTQMCEVNSNDGENISGICEESDFISQESGKTRVNIRTQYDTEHNYPNRQDVHRAASSVVAKVNCQELSVPLEINKEQVGNVALAQVNYQDPVKKIQEVPVTSEAESELKKPPKQRYRSLKSYTCDICGAVFRYHCNILNHKRKHTPRNFKCEICGKCCVNASKLLAHKQAHTGSRYKMCEICGKSVKGPSELARHMTSHTDARPYECDVCGKRFKDKYKLREHYKIHTGTRSYECEICGLTFTQSNALTSHIRTHTGDRPYACNICGKRFSQSNDVTKHKKTHTGYYPK